VPPYVYQWSNGAVDSVVSNLSAGPLQVIIFDSNGCSAITGTTLFEPDPVSPQVLAVSAYNGLYNVSCFGASDGEVDVSVVGGTPPYSFVWSNGDLSEDLMNISAGAYDLTVIDSMGCAGQLTVTMSQPDELLLQLSSPLLSNGANIACNGGSTGTVFSSVFGGTPPYSYYWNPSGITSDSLTQLPAGYYLLEVTDMNGCHSSSSITLTESPQLAVSMSSTSVACYGDSSGTVSAAGVAGGTAPYTYSWAGQTSANSIVASLPAGAYSVTVTDLFGCTATGSVTVTQPSQLVSSLTATLLPNGHHIACYGDLTGSIQSTVLGGTLPVDYIWSNGASTPDISGLPAGTYSLLVVDSNGCMSNQTVIITQPQQLQAVTSFTDPLCNGGATGSIRVDSVFGGTSPYGFTWSGTSSSAHDVQQLTAGTYSVTITDHSGCAEIRQFTLTDPPALVMAIDHAFGPLCHGGSNGELAFSVNGGTGTVQVSLSNSTAAGPLFSGLSAGIYTAVATDQNGCTVSLQATISDPPPVIADAGNDMVICDGNTAELGAVISAGQSGHWSSTDPAVFFENSAVPDAIVSGLSYGPNQLLWTVSDIYGCTDTATVIIRSFGGVIAEAGTDTVFCGDLGLLLNANLPADMSGMWTSINGAVFSDPFDPNAIVNIIHRGADTLQWTIRNAYCEKSDYLVLFSNDCGFDMPNGYSPNGDGKNDDFEIKGLYGYPDNYLRVFNRWGNLVFSYDDYTGHEWKGQNNAGDPLPDGTYFVLFVVNGSDFRKATYVDIRR
jgi:gliding motility-associated-like protein